MLEPPITTALPSRRSAAFTWLVTASILAMFYANDFYAARAIDEINNVHAVRAGSSLGLCIAQVTLIALWAALGPGNFIVRIPWSLLLGVTMWYTLGLGDMARMSGSRNAANMVDCGTALLVGIVGMQAPLWALKKFLGLRLLAPDDNLTTPRVTWQFQVKHVLIGTFLVAVALAPLKLFLGDAFVFPKRYDPYENWILGITWAVNMMTTLPCMANGWLSQRIGFRPIYWAIYAATVSAAEYFLLFLIFGTPGDDGICLTIAIMNVVQCLTVFVIARINRRLGYRLVRQTGKAAPLAAVLESDTDMGTQPDHGED